ncbi:MAG TPA: hypothetical protein VGO81_01395 [Solirubrobacteraceae bacterium]|nr:hypothetical protein [Solirubrobacteraceae bacterium]
MDRSYRIGPDGHGVLCDTVVGRGDIGALSDALAWRRDELSRVELDDAEAVLTLRGLMVVDDMLAVAAMYEGDAPLTVTRDQVHMLCEIAGAYVAERDVEGYQAPEERDRIDRLRGLAGPLMDCCSELAAAEDEVRERAISV